MTDKQIEKQIRDIKEVSKEISKNKEMAVKFLRDAGIPKVGMLTHSKKKK